jgi:hypothetical protein
MSISCDRVRDLAPGFVLGALDADEMVAVREHSRSCRMPHPELGEMGGVLPYLGGSLEPVEPPRHLKAAVLAAAQADLEARRVAAEAPAVTPAEAATAAQATRSGRVVSLGAVRRLSSRRSVVWLTRVAAAVIIVSLAGYVVAVQGDLDKAHQAQDHTNKVLNYLAVYGSRSTVMTPEPGQKGGGEAVMLPSGHVIVYLHGLQKTSGDEVYTLWLSSDGGALVKSGSFTADAEGEGFLELDSVLPFDSLWLMVCREPNGNAEKPGTAVVTGTIWVYSQPAPTPTR